MPSSQNSDRTLYWQRLEKFTWLLAILVLIFFLRDPLLRGTHLFTHDNYYWSYPVFHYFAVNIANFSFPLWNPYSHGGEAFYFLPGQLRLFEPLTYFSIFAAKVLGMDTVQAFVMNRLLGSLAMSFGAFLCLKRYAQLPLTRLMLIPLLLLSSFMFASFRQDGIYCQFVWAPFIYLFFQKIFFERENTLANWLGLAAVVGINWSSYFFAGAWLFLLILATAALLFEREALSHFWRGQQTKRNLICFFVSVFFMAAPNFIMFLERDQFVYPPRMLSAEQRESHQGAPMNYEGGIRDVMPPLSMNYQLVEATGSFTNIWDYLLPIYLHGNAFLNSNQLELARANPSEAIFYIGVLPWIIGLIGIFYARQRMRKYWIFVLSTYVLISLGPAGGLHHLLFLFFPPLWFMRHTHALVLYVHFAFLYFFTIGLDYVFSLKFNEFGKPSKQALRVLLASAVFALGLFFFFRSVDIDIYTAPYIFLPALLFVCLLVLLIYRAFATTAFLVLGIVLGQIVYIAANISSRQLFYGELLAFAILPVALSFLLGRRFPKLANHFRMAPILCAIVLNLMVAFYCSSELYHHTPTPKNTDARYDTIFSAIQAPLSRWAAPQFITEAHEETLRYPELIEGRAYALSNLKLENTVTLPKAEQDLFRYALGSRRWNSFLLPKTYFELIHQKVDSTILASIFSIERPLFSFRENFVTIADIEWANWIQSLGKDRALQLFNSYTSIDHGNGLAEALSPGLAEKNLAQAQKSAHFQFSYKSFSANVVEVDTKSDREGILYWADGYHKYWQAQLDGKPVPIYRANQNFKALRLPAGEHSFRFVFRPIPFELALMLYYIVFVAALGIALWGSLRKTKAMAIRNAK